MKTSFPYPRLGSTFRMDSFITAKDLQICSATFHRNRHAVRQLRQPLPRTRDHSIPCVCNWVQPAWPREGYTPRKFSLSTRRPVGPSACRLSACTSVHLSTRPPVRLSTCHLSACPPVRLSARPPSICPPVRLSTCPPVYQSARPPVCPPLRPSASSQFQTAGRSTAVTDMKGRICRPTKYV
jgi:hypothetical protein